MRKAKLLVLLICIPVALAVPSYLILSERQVQVPLEQFTWPYYEHLLEIVSNRERYNVITVNDYFRGDFNRDKVTVIITHDSDFMINEDFYRYERKYNIRSTYYIRPNVDEQEMPRYNFNDTKILDFLNKMQADGFEIGFHYDTLSYVNKNVTNVSELDYATSLQIFKSQLQQMRKYLDIKSIAAHGDFERLDINNFELSRRYENTMKNELNVNERYNIRPTVYASDARNLPENATIVPDPIQAILDAKLGNIILLNFHSEWWIPENQPTLPFIPPRE
ncbi:MAG: hypothetical protein M1503_01955 [Thaumarchaeota archaeon]|nr:hypothetical protein [Nitrososphaerota archaeon]MCL5317016.1 hypothetical protein [Nitrososphaerota archaeon]